MNGDQKIDEAIVDWDAPDDGLASQSISLRSTHFDDVYFSGDGPAETAHVFLHGNDLPARFDTPHFHIGELGFGTGLNFLAAWDAWRKAKKPSGATLHFFSIEAFPLSRADMARAHQAWPGLADLSARLRDRLPPRHPGFHQINLDERVTLTLFYGAAHDGLSRAEGKFDAWFLDGFSPAKNPQMWSSDLFAEMARLSRVHASFATFTVAGDVRRALESAGFSWEKRPGFGRKKHMLAGRLESPAENAHPAPWFAPQACTIEPGARIAIIGAGIAGASLANALTKAGFNPSVYDANGPASGASGNPAGLIMPRLDADDTPAGRFHVSAYFYTLQLLAALNVPSLFNACGATQYAMNANEGERHKKFIARPALPPGWMVPVQEGLSFPQAGVVDPSAFVHVLLGTTPILRERVSRLFQTDNGWRVISDKSDVEFDAVIIANGLDALRFADARTLPLSGSAGQIDWFADSDAPATAHVFGPYAAPAPSGGVVIGATYAPIAIGAETRFTAEATQSNIAAVARTLPALAAKLDPSRATPRASVRCTTPDQMPVVGAVPDWGFYAGAYDGLRTGRRVGHTHFYPPAQSRPGLFILTALGSRGLVTAPYAAAILAAEITGAPMPADRAVIEAVHPARFFVRDLKRSGTP